MTHPLLRKHLDTLIAIALAICVFGVYLWTLCPTIYWGDCAELATAVVTLGIPHPTGYPLYCLLGKAWTLLLPIGSLVWRLNVLSAVFGSLAIACCYGFARAVALPRPLALMAGGLLAFTYAFWQQSLVTETYSLAALFTCLLLFLATRWRAHGCQTRDLQLLAVAYGFALTSHQLNTLFLPGFVAFVLWSAPALRQWKDKSVIKEWAKILVLGALPLLTYLYLPIRARMHPAYNWGDPETLFAFYYHVSGRAFSLAMFHDPFWKVKLHFLSWVNSMPLEFSWPLAALCALGLGVFWRRHEDRPLALLLTWIVIVDVIFTINYGIYNAYIYYIPCYVVMAVCAGRCLLELWQTLEPHLTAEKQAVYAAFASVCVVALIPIQAIGHQKVSLRGNWTCYDYSRNLMASVPPHGILVENGDDTAAFGVAYQQIVEGQRRDIVLIRRSNLAAIYDPRYHNYAGGWYLQDLVRQYPRLTALYPAQGIGASQILSEEPLRRIMRDAVTHGAPFCVLAPAGTLVWLNKPFFTDDDGERIGLDVYLDRHYDTATIGLVTQVYAKGRKPSAPALYAETNRIWQSYSLRGVFDGGLQGDQYLAVMALNYGNGSLVRANLAYAQKDYAVAQSSYANVLSLFTCDAATQGLQRCAQAQHQALSADNSPRINTQMAMEKVSQ